MKKNTEKTDLLKVWKYGEWLEKYLAPEVTYWDLKELAEEATKLLNINFSFEDNEVSFHYLERMWKSAGEEGNIFENWHKLRSQFTSELTEDDPNATEDFFRFLDNYDMKGQDPFSPPPEIEYPNKIYYTPIASNIINNINEYRESITWILKEINNSNKPWFYTVSDLNNNEFQGFKIELLIRPYRELSEKLIISNNKVITANTFIFPGEKYRYNLFKWDTVISRIFFMFLINGGQDYFGFCNYCNKFYVTQRRGRKSYCSKICRTYASKERNQSN